MTDIERRFEDPDDILHCGFTADGKWTLCEQDHGERDTDPCLPIDKTA